MLTRHIALVPEVGMNASELARVSAALQKQVTRDLSPVWGISATVDPFPCLEELPAGYWPIVLTFRGLGVDAGIHLDEKGQPYALVEISPSWSLTASHICLEMLSDPFGNRMLAGRSPRPEQGEVEFLADICDPCEHPEYAYIVNDVLVSDFCTPSFWEPASRRDRYSFTGAVQAPLDVLPGGHLRWYDPQTDTWWTRRVSFNGPTDVNIGRADPKKSTAREFVDAHTPHHLTSTRMSADAFEARMGESQQQAIVAARSRAYLLRTTLGTSRNVESAAGGHELLDAHGRPRSDRRHPQVLGALLRAARSASGESTRYEPTPEEASLADEVEEITTVDDVATTYAAPAVPPVADAAPRTEYRTVPPPLPMTPPPVVIEQPQAAPPPAPPHVPVVVNVAPSSAPPVSIAPSMPAPPSTGPNWNSTVAIAAIAAAVVLGVALRSNWTPQASAGAANAARPTEPATSPAEPRPAANAPAVQAPVAPAAVAPAPVAPAVAAPAVESSAVAPAAAAPPAAPAPRPVAAVPARPKVVAAAPPARARSTEKPASESLESLIDDRR